MDKNKLSDILFPVLYMVNAIRQKFQPVYFYDEYETIELLKKGASIARFGDGELNIALGLCGVEEFQPFSLELQKKLVKCLQEKSNTSFLVAPLASLGSMKGYNRRQKKFYSTFYFKRRRKIIEILNNKGKGQIYGDPLFARIYGYSKQDSIERVYKKIELLNEIWKDKKILLVEGSTSQLGLDTDVLYSAQSIKRIIIPSKNAFEKYNEIVQSIRKQSDFDIILIIAGPTATILAYDLYKMGYWVIDFGQMQKSYKNIMPNNGGYKHSVISEEEYKEQIIDCISY